MSCEHVERDLHAYVDRELNADEAGRIRRHVEDCPSCRRQVAEIDGLGRMIRSTPYFTAPMRLRSQVAAQATRGRSTRALAIWAAAAAIVLVVGGAATLQWRTMADRNTTVEAVVDAHVRSLMADHLFDVESTDQHTVKPWFLGRIDFAPPVVDLVEAGFPLVGGRLDYIDGHEVAALVYRRQKHTINVFVRPEAGDTTQPVASSMRGFHLVRWRSGGMAFDVVSDLNQTELDEFARALRARS